jgi:hypothetical protein
MHKLFYMLFALLFASRSIQAHKAATWAVTTAVVSPLTAMGVKGFIGATLGSAITLACVPQKYMGSVAGGYFTGITIGGIIWVVRQNNARPRLEDE